jgi:hypothetical protein
VAAWRLSECGCTDCTQASKLTLTAAQKTTPFCPEYKGERNKDITVICGTEKVKVRTAYFHRRKKKSDGSQAGKRKHNGFIAQEVKEAADSMDFDFAGVQHYSYHKDDDGVPLGEDMWALVPTEFIAPLVGAVQQLSAQNTELMKRINALENK